MFTDFVVPENKAVLYRQNPLIVGIADYKVYDKPDRDIVTYSLGSCVGLTLFDPVSGVGGMIHCKLPDSKQFGEMAKSNPAAFPDSGVPELLSEMMQRGAVKRRLIAKVAGCAHVLKSDNNYNISERNYHATVEVLKKWAIRIRGEDVGKNVPRSVYLEMSTGKTLIRTGSEMYVL